MILTWEDEASFEILQRVFSGGAIDVARRQRGGVWMIQHVPTTRWAGESRRFFDPLQNHGWVHNILPNSQWLNTLRLMFGQGMSGNETPNCCAEQAGPTGPKPTEGSLSWPPMFPSRQCCRPDSAMVTRVKMAHLKSQCVS